jgi:hypothetical protein
MHGSDPSTAATCDRRTLLTAGAAMAGSVALAQPFGAAPARAAAGGAAVLQGPYLDLRTGPGNRDMLARINGNLDIGKVKYGWYSGLVMAVVPGGPIRDLFGMTGFSCARLLPQEKDGSFRKVLREVGLYHTIGRDGSVGEILEEWKNPYHGETVKVVPIANDPFNQLLEEFMPQPPSYGGLNTEVRAREPLVLPWEVRGNVVNLFRHINLFYPNALQPDRWPRESAGPMVQVTEAFIFNFNAADIQDRRKTSLTYTGTWSRITPWLPWMLMGQAPGHIWYQTYQGAEDSFDALPVDRKIKDYVAKNFPLYLDAPTEWKEPSLSSIENFAREQKPAPPRPAGAPPFNMHPPA